MYRATGLRVIWKDADPTRWSQWPRSLSQHRSAYCVAIKRSVHRLAQCCAADTTTPTEREPCARTCPFGVREYIVPFHRGGQLLGWCFVGPFSNRSHQPSVAQDAYAQLPHFAADRARAAAELIRRLVGGILHAHAAGPQSTDPRVRAVDEFLDHHLTARTKAHQIATHLGLSPSRFVHWFKAATGVPISQYMQQRLMRQAAERLLGDNKAVTNVAMDLDYPDPSAFTAAFRRFYGEPPSRWRQRMALSGES